MPELTQVRLGKKTEPPIVLRKSDDLIAVRTRSTRSIRSGAVRTPESGEVADGHLVFTIPEAGVEVFRVPPGLDDGRWKTGRMRSARPPMYDLPAA